MISFFKRLFGESQPEEPVSISSIATAPAPEKSSPPPRPRTTALPKASASSPPAACLSIPLRSVADRLPASLRSRVTRSPGESEALHVPLDSVLEQLPRGAVRLSFREIRERSTPGYFSPAHDVDDTMVELPLAEILCRLPAAHLRRSPEQKTLSVPQNIPAVFGARAAGAPATQAPKPAPPPKQTHASAASLMTDQLHTPKPAPTPAASLMTDQLHTTRVLSVPIQPAAVPSPRPTTPTPASKPMPTLSTALRLEQQPLPPPSPSPISPAPVQAEPVSSGADSAEPVKVPLVPLARTWPEQLRREIMATHLAASVNIPFAELETALKRGKAVFSWKQIRLWMTPKVCTSLTEHDSVGLELPLPILTPLFLARRANHAPTKKTAALPELPDIFSSKKNAEPAPELPVAAEAPARPAPAPSAVAPKAPAPEPPVSVADRRPTNPGAASMDRLTMARSSPLPTQLVQRACHLSGVSGALLATSDGLVIASQMGPGMSAEAIAGFLPEIYSRLGHYTRELKLGDPSHIEMLAGNIPLQIFKTANSYYAIFGKPAEPLPKLQLTALAAQLSQQTH